MSAPRALRLYNDLASAWSGEIEAWCRASAARVLAGDGPSWLVCSTRGQADWARSMLFRAGGATLGLQFLTPFSFRAQLGAALGVPLLTTGREVLEFAARLSAEARGEKEIALDPSGWMQSLDEADSAGMLETPEFFSRLVPASMAPFVARLRAHPAWLPGVDRRLRAAGHASHVLREVRLGLVGIDETCSRLQPLIKAAAAACGGITMWLPAPRSANESAAQAWCETLERALPAALESMPMDAGARNAAFVESIELAAVDPSGATLELVTGVESRDEIECAAASIARWLVAPETPGYARFVVVFPTRSATSLLLSRALARRGIRHEDRIGERPEPDESTRLLRALVAYYREGHSAPALLRLRAERDATLDPARQIEEEDRLVYRFGDIQSARAKFCALRSEIAPLATQLGEWPERAPLAEFHRIWLRAIAAVGLDAAAVELFWNSAASWVPETEAVSGRAVLATLEAALAATPSRYAENARNTPNARIVLTTLEEATGQTWSGVLLMQCVESVWPAAPVIPRFLPDGLRRTWNQRPGVTRLATSSDALGSQEAAWLNLLAQCDGPIAFASSQLNAAEPDRPEFPNAWLLRAVSARGRDAPMEFWRKSARAVDREPTDLPDAVEFRAMHDRRADPSAPFDEYSFDFSALAPHEPTKFSPSKLDGIVAGPGRAALRHLFQAAERRDLERRFVRRPDSIVGDIVHEELALRLARACPPGVRLTRGLLQDELSAPRPMVKALRRLNEMDEPITTWWHSLLARAGSIVRGFLHALQETSFSDGSWTLVTERKVTREAEPFLEGRLDLEFRRGEDIAVVDYKTGGAPSLNAAKGTGLELVGYAWCLEETSGDLLLTFVRVESPDPSRKLSRAALSDFEPWRKRLSGMQRDGRYGLGSPLHDRSGGYTKESLPITTREIPSATLEARLRASGWFYSDAGDSR